MIKNILKNTGFCYLCVSVLILAYYIYHCDETNEDANVIENVEINSSLNDSIPGDSLIETL